MMRMRVLVVGVAIISSMMGCLSPNREPQALEQQAVSAVATTDTAETGAVSSQDDGMVTSPGEDPPSTCGDGVCGDEDVPATSSEVLSLLASDPVQFAAVMETTFPGYNHDAAELLRQQILTEDVKATVASAVADAAARGEQLRERSQTSRELEAVGYFFAQSLLSDQHAPPDAPYLAMRRGLIFGAAVLDELQGIASAQDNLILSLKTDEFGDRYLLIRGQWGFGWITDAYKWVKQQLSDGWRWTRNEWRRLRWNCISATLRVAVGCSPCIAAALTAAETAGGSLSLAQQACGVSCVSSFISAAQSCK